MSHRMMPFAAITITLLLSSQHPAAAQPPDPPAPTLAWRDGDPQAVIARVLGKPVTRGDLAAAAEARRTHRFPDGRTVQAPEDVATQVAMIDIILMPLLEEVARTQSFQATAAEVANHHANEDRWRGRLRQALSPDPDAERAAIAAESIRAQLVDVEVMEEIKHGIRADLASQEAWAAQAKPNPTPASKPTPEADRDRRQIVTLLKSQVWLFERFGGAAAWVGGPVQGLIAPDATRTWLAEREKAGDLKFSEPTDREAFLIAVDRELDNMRAGQTLLRGDEAKALLARTPGWAPLEPEPPAPKPEKPVEPVAPAPPPPDPNEVLAEVLGVSITRSQIDPSHALAWASQARREVDPAFNIEAQTAPDIKPGGSRDRAALTELLLMPLIEREARRNGFLPTEAELLRFHAAVRAQDIDQLGRVSELAQTRSEAARPDFDQQTRASFMDHIARLEAAAEARKDLRAEIQAERIDRLDAEQQKAWRAFLLRSKAHRWLFDRYGGAVSGMGPYGTLYAAEAIDQWLAEQEREGRLRFMNYQLRKAFYNDIAARTKRALPHDDWSLRGDEATRLARQHPMWEE